jgi:hypothetical protein
VLPDAVGDIWSALDLFEEMLNGSRNDTALVVVLGGARHGEGLAGAGLTVAEHGAIVALQGLQSDVLDDSFVDALLGHIVHDVVHLEGPVRDLVVHVALTSRPLAVVYVDLFAVGRVLDHLRGEVLARSTSKVDFDSSLLGSRHSKQTKAHKKFTQIDQITQIFSNLFQSVKNFLC